MNIEWMEAALDDWADIYVAATPAERELLTRAYREVNDHLSRNAQFLGESRRDGERVWFFHPFMVRYVVIPHGPVRVGHLVRLRGSASPPPDDDADA